MRDTFPFHERVMRKVVTATVDNIKTAFVYAMNIGRVVKLENGLAIVMDVSCLTDGRYLIELEPIKKVE